MKTKNAIDVLDKAVADTLELITDIANRSPETCKNTEFAKHTLAVISNAVDSTYPVEKKINSNNDFKQMPFPVVCLSTLFNLHIDTLQSVMLKFSNGNYVDGVDIAEQFINEYSGYDAFAVSTLLGVILSTSIVELRKLVLEKEPEMMQFIMERCEKPTPLFTAKFKPYLNAIIDYYEEVERESKFGIEPIGYSREEQFKAKLMGMLS